MGISKYKYYFKKPRSAICKDILKWLVIAGAVSLAAASPYFLTNILKYRRQFEKYPKKNFSNTFYRLRKQGLINVQRSGHQIYISLTPEGKKRAGWLQIDALKIAKPKKWDKKWRLAMFDIAQLKKFSREALRGKLKEMGFCTFQKSVWIHPFNCEAEIELLKNFFGLSDKELRLITAENIGNDAEFRKVFNL